MSIVTAERKHQYDRDGYFITPPLFDEAFIQKVSAECDRLWSSETQRTGGPYRNDQQPGEPPFMIALADRNPVIAGIFRHPALVAVYRAMLGDDLDLNYDQIVMKQPESVSNHTPYEFAFHQDNYYALRGGEDSDWNEQIFLDNHRTCQGWLAFTETTLENGTLFVIPGAHRHGLLDHERGGKRGFDCAIDPRVDVSQQIPVLLQPGQLLLFSGLLPHGSGLNRSASARKILQFCISVPGGRPSPFGRPILRKGQSVF